jgi:hypothetical protein
MKMSTAIQRMRIARQAHQEFGLMFYASKAPFGLRKIERCTLRSRPIDAAGDKKTTGRKFDMTDRFLYFTDLSTGEAKQCRKRLITKVRFGNDWYEVTLE